MKAKADSETELKTRPRNERQVLGRVGAHGRETWERSLRHSVAALLPGALSRSSGCVC